MALFSLRLRRSLSLSSSLFHCSRNRKLHLDSSGRISTLLFNPSLSSSNLEADAQTSKRPFNSQLQSPVNSSQLQSPVNSSQLQCFRFFGSSPVALSTRRQYQGANDDQEIGADTILFEGCDYKHWLITIEFPKDEQITPEQMVETYVRTAAKVFGSVEEAKKRIYACSTTTYQGFQVECSQETSEMFEGLPGVVFVLPDSYIDPVNKEYGGDKYINGTIIPRPPPIQYNNRPLRGQRDQRNQRYGDGGQMQGETRNFDRPPRENYDSRQGPPPQPNYGRPQISPTQQNYGPPTQQNYGPLRSSPSPQSNGFPQGPSQQYHGQPQGTPSQQSHGLPQDRPSQQNYGPPNGPPSQRNYGSPQWDPTSQQNYGPPPRVPPFQQNYDPQSRVPTSQQNYGPPPRVPPSQQNYDPPSRVPTSQQNYGPPPRVPLSQQNYDPPSQVPASQQHYGPPSPQGPPHQQNFGLHSSQPQPNNENAQRQQNYSMPARQNYTHTQDLSHQQNFGRQQNYVPEKKYSWQESSSPKPQSYGVPTAISGGGDGPDYGYSGQRHLEGQSQSSLSTQGGNFSPGLDGSQRQEAGTLYNKSYLREGSDSRFSQSEPRNNFHAGEQVADQVGTGRF